MTKRLRALTLASLVLGAFVSASPLLAHEKAKPSTSDNMMQHHSKMGGMDMMGMMEQMNKMMGLCNKMMETAMNDKDGPGMQMQKEEEKALEKKP